jgi:hypothetical protein
MPRDEFDDEEDDAPRPRQRKDRDDDRPHPPANKPALVTAAGVLWCVLGVFCLLSAAVTLVQAMVLYADDQADVSDLYFPCSGCNVVLVLGVAGVCGLGAVLALSGKARSLLWVGILALALPAGDVLAQTGMSFFLGVEMTKDGPPEAKDLALRMAFRTFLFSCLLMSGVVLAGIFTLVANRRYREWWTGRRR